MIMAISTLLRALHLTVMMITRTMVPVSRPRTIPRLLRTSRILPLQIRLPLQAVGQLIEQHLHLVTLALLRYFFVLFEAFLTFRQVTWWVQSNTFSRWLHSFTFAKWPCLYTNSLLANDGLSCHVQVSQIL